MTVSYSGNFYYLLLRWRGSLWKSLYKDLVLFLLIYYVISFCYRFVMNDADQKYFEKAVVMCNEYTKNIPLHFLLGFYVGLVVKRWWEQFESIPWPDSFLYWVSAYVQGDKLGADLIKCRIARFLILSAALAMRSLSPRVYKRFPTFTHLEQSGLMSKAERMALESVQLKYTKQGEWWIPLTWILDTLNESFDENRIRGSIELRQLIQALEEYRQAYERLFIYEWVSIPLLYTQLCTISTHGYFALCLLGRQYLAPQGDNNKEFLADLYFPFYTILQFLFYVGWLKVAEDLLNPFGEDDEDFELNYLLDRHAEMAYVIVRGSGQQPPVDSGKPELFQRGFEGLNHTKASAANADVPPLNHLIECKITEEQSQIAPDVANDFSDQPRHHPLFRKSATFRHNQTGPASLSVPTIAK